RAAVFRAPVHGPVVALLAAELAKEALAPALVCPAVAALDNVRAARAGIWPADVQRRANWATSSTFPVPRPALSQAAPAAPAEQQQTSCNKVAAQLWSAEALR